jgi:hypothetical protein
MNRLSRRRLLQAAIAGGGVVAAGSATAVSARPTSTVTFDLAWLGQTTKLLPMPPMNPGALDPGGAFRGWAVYTEGSIYPAGTIPGTPDAPSHGWNPASARHIGTFFGWGFVVEDLNRTPSTDPTLLLTCQYVLGRIDDTNYFPADQLVSSGLEFAHSDQTQPNRPRQHATQPVTGGAGVYAGASGVVVKRYIGTNSSAPDDTAHAPRNYRLEFNL